MYGNPEEIRRQAIKIRQEAEMTRMDAGRGARADAVQWKSRAAQRYREQLGDAARQAGSATGELEKVSDLLLRHAAAVQEQLDRIAAAERWFRGQADRAGREARGLGSTALQVGGDVVEGMGDFLSGSLDWAQRQGEQLAGEAQQRADDLNRQVARLPGGDRGWLEAARARGWAG